MKATALFLPLVTVVALAACGDDDSTESAATSNPTQPPPESQQSLDPADFSTTIDHSMLPLSSLGPKVFEGEETDEDTGETVLVRIEHTILPDTFTVAGVEVLVLNDKEYKDGELVEDTRDYFAQHRDGSVWYLGENVDMYEDGEVVSHEGQWLAGEGENEAGIFMPAELVIGKIYQQEYAPGVAEDRFEVIALDQSVTTPAGTFTGCLKTEDSTPLEDAREFKYYCPGVGLVREEPAEGVVELVSYE